MSEIAKCFSCGKDFNEVILYPDYRGPECLSKYPSCANCLHLTDEAYFEQSEKIGVRNEYDKKNKTRK